jgi:phosphocarrier protein
MSQLFQAEVQVHRDDQVVNGKSILDLVTLAAECGVQLVIEASGCDAEAAISALSRLIESGFHESVEGPKIPLLPRLPSAACALENP